MKKKATTTSSIGSRSSDLCAPSSDISLDDVLGLHGLDRGTFDGLPGNCYEHALARENPALLHEFYKLLFAPGLTLAEVVDMAPAWPARTPRAGAKPSDAMVSNIGKRWRAEKVLNGFESVNRFVDGIRSKLSVLPSATSAPVMESLFDLLGQELLAAKLNGMPVSQQLEAMDRMLAKRKLEIAQEDARLARERFERETCELFLKWNEDQRAKEIAANSESTHQDKLEALGQLMFGSHFEGLKSSKTKESARMPYKQPEGEKP